MASTLSLSRVTDRFRECPGWSSPNFLLEFVLVVRGPSFFSARRMATRPACLLSDCFWHFYSARFSPPPVKPYSILPFYSHVYEINYYPENFLLFAEKTFRLQTPLWAQSWAHRDGL